MRVKYRREIIGCEGIVVDPTSDGKLSGSRMEEGIQWLGTAGWDTGGRSLQPPSPLRPPSQDPSAATLVRFLKKIQIFSTFFLVCSLHLLPTVLLHKTHRFLQPSPDFSKRSKYYQLAFPPSSLKSLLFACSPPSSTDPPRFRKETIQIHK